MFGTIRKHSQALWIPIIVLVSISMVWFFTNSDPSTLLQRGQGGTTTLGQEQVLIGAAVQFWQRTGQLPRRASEILPAQDLDGDGNRDVDGLVLMGAIRQDLLERTVALEIQFDDDAVNSIIREQLSDPRGQFQQKAYDQLIQSFGEGAVRLYFHDELAIRHLHQVMGLGGGMISRRAFRPMIEQQLLEYDTEVAVFRAAEYTNQVTNIAERLITYYTDNNRTYKDENRVKFAWLKIAVPTNAANKAAIKQAQLYQTEVYEGLRRQGTNLATLSQIATKLKPPLKIERTELAEGNVTSHDLSSLFRLARTGEVGDVQVHRESSGVYFASVEEEIEGSLPDFKSLTPGRSNEVLQAFLTDETQKLAEEAGRSFYTNLTAALVEGNHTFDKFCRSNKVEVFTVPLFSSTTQPGPVYAPLTNRVELMELQRAVLDMDPSKEKIRADRISKFNPNNHGGWILNLKQRVPASAEQIEAKMSGGFAREYRRAGLVHATQTHRVPSSNPQQRFQVADPTWNFRHVERIKLEFYIATKEDRRKEIDSELEKLRSQLTVLTKQGNPNATEAEFRGQEQQMDAIRQQLRQLERERGIISQAETRLKELKK